MESSVEQLSQTVNGTAVLMVTANVGSLFEDPERLLHLWTDEFLAAVSLAQPLMVALHCQEVGGKNYGNSVEHVRHFINVLLSSQALRYFNRARIYLDEDYSTPESFTALGSLYFVHEQIADTACEHYDFQQKCFVSVVGKEVFSGNIESVATKEKAKFPQEFFPECKWSRKGFLRTRWSLCGTVFDLINVHLFHDASNLIAMKTSPSVYGKNRRRALEYILQRFHSDAYGKAPYFIFGDFNFRPDTNRVIEKLATDIRTTRAEYSKNGDCIKVEFTNPETNEIVLTVGKKEFRHWQHQDVFFNALQPHWLNQFDKETEVFVPYLAEYAIHFPPSFPFEEQIAKGEQYMLTRCPAWCDRILFTHTAQQLVCTAEDAVEYGTIGQSVCMGDHKPVFLNVRLRRNAGWCDAYEIHENRDGNILQSPQTPNYVSVKCVNDDTATIFKETPV